MVRSDQRHITAYSGLSVHKNTFQRRSWNYMWDKNCIFDPLNFVLHRSISKATLNTISPRAHSIVSVEVNSLNLFLSKHCDIPSQALFMAWLVGLSDNFNYMSLSSFLVINISMRLNYLYFSSGSGCFLPDILTI